MMRVDCDRRYSTKLSTPDDSNDYKVRLALVAATKALYIRRVSVCFTEPDTSAPYTATAGNQQGNCQIGLATMPVTQTPVAAVVGLNVAGSDATAVPVTSTGTSSITLPAETQFKDLWLYEGEEWMQHWGLGELVVQPGQCLSFTASKDGLQFTVHVEWNEA